MTIIKPREDEESTSFYKKNERLLGLLMIVGAVDGVGISDTWSAHLMFCEKKAVHKITARFKRIHGGPIYNSTLQDQKQRG